MSVYRPTYRDQKTGKPKQQTIWWYHFTFDGRHIQESSKSPRKTVATEAEKKRRQEFETGTNDIDIKDKRKERIRSVTAAIDSFLEAYRLRHPQSVTFAEYALGHVGRILGKKMAVDVTDSAVKEYQSSRLREKASPKSINEEVGLLLRVLEERGDVLRAKLKRRNALKLTVLDRIAKAFTLDEKAALIAEARKRRSPAIVPALMLALHAGMRDAEIRGLQWGRVDLLAAIVTVGDSKTEAGRGRTIPLNGDLLAALKDHSRWYLDRFGETRPEWYVFPFGTPQPTDPTKPATTFKTVWVKIRAVAKVQGRWHDNRHTFITDLAESPDVSDETIRQLAGHVSKQMLEHYSHIRMGAKRRAVDALVVKPAAPSGKKASRAAIPVVPAKESAKVSRFN